MKLTYVIRQVVFTTLMAILSLPVFSQEGGSLRYFMQEGTNSPNSIPYGNNVEIPEKLVLRQIWGILSSIY